MEYGERVAGQFTRGTHVPDPRHRRRSLFGSIQVGCQMSVESRGETEQVLRGLRADRRSPKMNVLANSYSPLRILILLIPGSENHLADLGLGGICSAPIVSESEGLCPSSFQKSGSHRNCFSIHVRVFCSHFGRTMNTNTERHN